MTNSLPPLVETTATRLVLHHLAEHVLAGEQVAANGDYRLEVTPAGFATRWFTGPDQVTRRVRVEGAELIHETEQDSIPEPIPGAIDPLAASVLYSWWELGWRVLNDLAQSLGPESSDVVLYPEHFDIGSTADFGTDGNLNLGFSPGDDFCPAPYVYAGPWVARAGEFWNAPFGAYRRYDQIDAVDADKSARAFLDAAIAEFRS